MEQYNKLVRDNIPEIIHDKGGSARIRYAEIGEYREKLLEKLLEEAGEFSINPSPEELADILEVVDALYENFGFSREDVAAVKERKRLERGAFKKRIILEES